MTFPEMPQDPEAAYAALRHVIEMLRDAAEGHRAYANAARTPEAERRRANLLADRAEEAAKVLRDLADDLAPPDPH